MARAEMRVHYADDSHLGKLARDRARRHSTRMGRRRKAWLTGGDGIRCARGKRLPGYYAEWHEPHAGRDVHRSRHFLKQLDARRFVREFNARRDLDALGDIIRLTVPEAGREFLRGCTALARDTRTHYRSSIALLAGWLPEGRMLCEIGGPDIDGFVAWRLRLSSPATVAKHVRSLRRFFRWAILRNYLAANPLVLATSLPKGRQARERPPVSERQLARLYANLDTDDRRVAVLLALTSGLDRGVIEQLHADNIDLDTATIRVRRPKTGAHLILPLHPSLIAWLAARADRSPPGRPLLQGLNRQAAERDWWKRATRAAGCPDLLFRDLRALAAHRLQRVPGMTLPHAQRLLGHASIDTTARHYTMPAPELRRAFEQLPLPGYPPGVEPNTN